MPHHPGIRPFQVRTEERDGRVVLAMSGDLALESAGLVIAALDRACEGIQPEIVLDLRDLSFIASGEIRAPVTAEVLAGVRGGGVSTSARSEPVPAAHGVGPAPHVPGAVAFRPAAGHRAAGGPPRSSDDADRLRLPKR